MFYIDIFSIIYSHLMLDTHITTGMVNKNKSYQEHIRAVR